VKRNFVPYPTLIISTWLIKPVNSVSNCCWHVCRVLSEKGKLLD
jgi:hypothetical protein